MGEQLPLHQDLDVRVEQLKQQLQRERNARAAAEAEVKVLRARVEKAQAILRGEAKGTTPKRPARSRKAHEDEQLIAQASEGSDQ